jgi:hypothetical protein
LRIFSNNNDTILEFSIGICQIRESTVKELMNDEFFENVDFFRLLIRDYDMEKECNFNYEMLYDDNSWVKRIDYSKSNNFLPYIKSMNELSNDEPGFEQHPNYKYFASL